jgi:hypothetical protein
VFHPGFKKILKSHVEFQLGHKIEVVQ